MRLRFFHLPAFGPLREAAVGFQQNGLLPREGAMNFVVGVNGTGKSSLLRAAYVAIHSLDGALDSSAPLPFAFTLAYDANHLTKPRTVLFWHPGGAVRHARLGLFDRVLSGTSEREWLVLAERCAKDDESADLQVIPGERFMGSGGLREHLPRQVLAYTSGDCAPWEQAVEHFYDVESLEVAANTDVVERPRRWDLSRERAAVNPDDSPWAEEIREEQTAPQLPTALPRCVLLRPEETRLAALALAVWHMADEFKTCGTDAKVEQLRQTLLASREQPTNGPGARRLLQEADWFRATHLSLTASPGHQTGSAPGVVLLATATRSGFTSAAQHARPNPGQQPPGGH